MSFLKSVNNLATKSYEISPSEYRGVNGDDEIHYWPDTTFENEKIFKYKNCVDAVKAFQTCPPLASVIIRMAQAYINGQTWIMNTKGKEATSEPAKKIRKLFSQPNPLQSWKEFEAQQEVYMDLFGWFLLLPVVPFGYEEYGALEATSMWNIPPNLLSITETNKLFYQTKLSGIIDKIKLNYRDNNTELKIDQMHIFKDFVPSFSTMVFPDSRIRALEMPINNIIGALESRNVLINYRGALGIFTQEPNRGSFVTRPMSQDEKENLQKDFLRYGLKKQQWKFIISSATIKWQQMGIPTRELMLFEEIVDDVMRICDAYGFPSPLINSEKGPAVSNTKQFKAQLYQDAIIPRAEMNYDQWNKIFKTDELSLKIEKDYSKVAVLQEDEKVKYDAKNSLADYTLKMWKADMMTRNRFLFLNGEDVLGPEGDVYFSEWTREQLALNPAPAGTAPAGEQPQ